MWVRAASLTFEGYSEEQGALEAMLCPPNYIWLPAPQGKVDGRRRRA